MRGRHSALTGGGGWPCARRPGGASAGMRMRGEGGRGCMGGYLRAGEGQKGPACNAEGPGGWGWMGVAMRPHQPWAQKFHRS
jgi:hypothetical protein